MDRWVACPPVGLGVKKVQRWQGGGGCKLVPPIMQNKRCKNRQKYATKKRQTKGIAMHDTLLWSISTTATLLHNWSLFICCIRFLITVTIIKRSIIVNLI